MENQGHLTQKMINGYTKELFTTHHLTINKLEKKILWQKRFIVADN